MAARLNRRHSEQIRAKIQASVIVTRLHQHVLGEVEMTPSQVAAANSLLDRSVPKLSQIQHVGDEDGGPIQHSMTVEFVDASAVPKQA
jgi:hypothetical protein